MSEISSGPEHHPVASVIIPAHDEERVIGRCLDALLQGRSHQDIEIIVAANGCTDGTVDVAGSRHGVLVLDVPEASKVAALNAGDQAARSAIRIFLDADIVLSEDALSTLVAALRTDRAIAAAPRVLFNTAQAGAGVRAFYRIFEQLPYATDNLVGLGVYGLSASGRARFEAFPQVISDDLFVQRLFDRSERVLVDSTFEVQVPRTLRQLLKVRTRIAKGNAQLAETPEAPGSRADFSASTASTMGALVKVLRARPRLVPHAVVYVGVTVAARARARRAASGRWERDTSTR